MESGNILPTLTPREVQEVAKHVPKVRDLVAMCGVCKMWRETLKNDNEVWVDLTRKNGDMTWKSLDDFVFAAKTKQKEKPQVAEYGDDIEDFEDWFKKSLQNKKKKVTDSPGTSSSGTSSPVGKRKTRTLNEPRKDFVEPFTLGEPKPELLETDFNAIINRADQRDLRMSIDRFAANLEKVTKGDVPEMGAAVKNFLVELQTEMCSRMKWDRLAPERLADARESMAKYVFAKLVGVVYGRADFVEEDNRFKMHVSSLRDVVTPEFLDLKVSHVKDNGTFAAAVRELNMIDSAVTPAGKLKCIFNACRLLLFILQDGGAAAGADDFLPLFIMVVIRADIRHMHTNIQLIEYFLSDEDRFGEAFCYYTHLMSASAYVESLTRESVIKSTSEKIKRETALKEEQSTQDLEEKSRALLIARSRLSVAGPLTPLKTHNRMRSFTESEYLSQPLSSSMPLNFGDSAGDLGNIQADCDFLNSLHFLRSSAQSICSKEDIELLLSEYKRCFNITQKYIPAMKKRPSWNQEACIRNFVLAMPLNSKITALTVHQRNIWVGFENGRVGIFRADITAEKPLVCFITVFSCAISKFCLSPTTGMFCLSAKGQMTCIDPMFYSVGKPVVLHDKAHLDFVDLVSYGASIISVARSTEGRTETQIARYDIASGRVMLSKIVPGNIVVARVLCSQLWTVHIDGTLHAYNPTTGERNSSVQAPVITRLTPGMNLSATCLDEDGKMWISAGDFIYLLDAAKCTLESVKDDYLKVGCNIMDMQPLATVWGADDISRHFILCLNEQGEIIIRDERDGRCEAVIDNVPRTYEFFCTNTPQIQNMHQDPLPGVWVVSIENLLYCWCCNFARV